MKGETVVIGVIDRSGCKGCQLAHKLLSACTEPYIDLASEVVTCDFYRPTPQPTTVTEGGDRG